MLMVYALLIRALAPLIRLHLRARARRGKEIAARLGERFGTPSAPAFTTRPVWLHAASVGEAGAALALVPLLRQNDPLVPLVITTGTVTSAKLVASRLPALAVHQFAPLDHPDGIARFLDFWRPRLSLRLESELWPVTIAALQARRIPSLLINAHMSPRSFRAWRKWAPNLARQMVQSFDLVLCESPQSARHFQDLGAQNVQAMANLKLMADPLPVLNDSLVALQQAVQNRPLWVYASTHKGEEIIAAQIHRALRDDLPGLLTVIVPRHPDRRAEIRADLPRDLQIDFRSVTPVPDSKTDIYVADTLGELGVFYTLAPVAVIGRSFSLDGGGGHNPIEAILAGCHPLSGPHVQNLQAIYDHLRPQNAVEILDTPDDLRARLRDILAQPTQRRAQAQAARDQLQALQETIRTDMAAVLRPFLAS